jgi:phage terminase small subunit
VAKRNNNGLNPKQTRFVAEYMVDLNATQAAIRAGYSAKTAGAIGEKLLKKAEISADIERRKTAQLDRVEVRADGVLTELKRLGLSDLRDAFDSNGHLLDVKSLPDDIAHSIAGIEVEELFDGHGEDREHIGRVKKIKLWDKNKALENLGRHLTLFVDRQEHTGKDGAPLTWMALVESAAKK